MTSHQRLSVVPVLVACLLAAASLSAQPVVSTSFETMRLQSSSVSPRGGGGWDVDLTVQPDNGNASLPSSWRRWWHCQIANLNTGGDTLAVRVLNAGYTDVILPVWALSSDGVTFGDYMRVPTSAVPQVSGSTHRFTLLTPPGTRAIRLAKFFPYSTATKAAFVASLQGHPSGRVRSVRSIGSSWQGRPIEMVELTDASVPDAGKTRLWVHSGVHPAETTSYFAVEGLIGFLLSSDPLAAALLRAAIVDVVPMANPDGVFLGNYRSNSRSVEIESQWGSPYNSNEREVIALRSQIEAFMGTASSPGSNPIELVLNLHSSHNVAFPFHFQHSANANWSPGNNSGVVPTVNALEGSWISALRARSAFVNLGSTQSSSCGAPSRPFVECMMHDRWSVDPAWTGAPNRLPQVMAITFEGTYGRGPDGVTWNTQDDYRDVGVGVGRALFDFLGLSLPPLPTWLSYGPSCGVTQTATAVPSSNGALLTLAGSGGPANAPGAMLVGVQRTASPLPPPWTCFVLTVPLGSVPLVTDATGSFTLPLPFPPIPGLLVDVQAAVADIVGPVLQVRTSNGLEVRNPF